MPNTPAVKCHRAVPVDAPPPIDAGAFLRRLYQLKHDATRVDWGGLHGLAARLNAITLCNMVAEAIAAEDQT